MYAVTFYDLMLLTATAVETRVKSGKGPRFKFTNLSASNYLIAPSGASMIQRLSIRIRSLDKTCAVLLVEINHDPPRHL